MATKTINKNLQTPQFEEKHGYFMYPDTKVFWGVNVIRNGSHGIEVPKQVVQELDSCANAGLRAIKAKKLRKTGVIPEAN